MYAYPHEIINHLMNIRQPQKFPYVPLSSLSPFYPFPTPCNTEHFIDICKVESECVLCLASFLQYYYFEIHPCYCNILIAYSY